MPSSSELEWKAWPGGNADTSLNATETFTSSQFGFTGNCNWDVGQGVVDGKILETGTTTATNRSSITVGCSPAGARVPGRFSQVSAPVLAGLRLPCYHIRRQTTGNRG
jgi:hypothetical protein